MTGPRIGRHAARPRPVRSGRGRLGPGSSSSSGRTGCPDQLGPGWSPSLPFEEKVASSSPSSDGSRPAGGEPAVSSSVHPGRPSSRNGSTRPSRSALDSPPPASARGRPSAALGRSQEPAAVPAGSACRPSRLLEPDQVVPAPLMAASVATGRLLEGRGGEEARRVERLALVTQQDGWAVAAHRPRRGPSRSPPRLEALRSARRQEVDVAGLVDPDLREHLPDDRSRCACRSS